MAIKSIAKKSASFMLGLALVASIGASTVSAQSTSAARCTFTRDLTVGSRGADVTCLQLYLTSTGHFTFSGGATGYFGSITQSAVAKWQAANGVSPTAGYFGPISRAKYGAMVNGTPGNPGTPPVTPNPNDDDDLEGGEGELNVEGNLGDVESTVEEGEEDVQVLGVELEAEDSDIMIERVDVDFAIGTGGSDNLDDYITEVSIWLDGEELDRLDVDEADEDDDIYSFRFSGLDGIIREGDIGELYVAVNGVNNIDSDDTDVNITVDIESDGIRAVDAEGISETYVTEAEVDAETFQVDEATVGDLRIRANDDNPDSASIVIDEEDRTDDVTILAFDLEAEDQTIIVEDLPVTFTTSVGGGVEGPVLRAMLVSDGDVLDTVTIPSSAGTTYEVVFEDLDLEIEEGDEVSLEVVVDLNDEDATTFPTGTTLYASVNGNAAAWDAEDENGEEADVTGSLTGETMTFVASGVTVEGVSTSAEDDPFGTSGSEQGTYTIRFDVTAVEDDFYVYKGADIASSSSAGVIYTVKQDNTATSTLTASELSDNLTAESQSGDTSDYFLVREGDTRTFTLQVVVNPATTGFYSVELEAVRYDATEDNSAIDDATFTVPNEDEFETDDVQLNA
jgi:hypothetical protein